MGQVQLIPFKEMVKYYSKITSAIYNEIEEVFPTKHKGLCKTVYSEEYKNAYGWLQRADWRLAETESMRKYYTEPEFKYYGLENLSNVHHRIEGYLKNTEFKFTESVTDYHKYDDIIAERMDMVHDPDFHKYFNYYLRLHDFEQFHESIGLDKHWLISDLESFERRIQESSFITNKEELNNKLTELKQSIEDLEIKYEIIKP